MKGYKPEFAHPTERLELLVRIRSINPLYGVFLAGHLAIADDTERDNFMGGEESAAYGLVDRVLSDRAALTEAVVD